MQEGAGLTTKLILVFIYHFLDARINDHLSFTDDNDDIELILEIW